MAQLWDLIHAERTALVDDLERIDAMAWSTPSLCSRWTVHQVLGHMASTAKLTAGRFIIRFAGSGFRFNAMADRDVAVETRGGPAQTLAEFTAHATDKTSPPGPKETWLGETVLHSEDIRRPLGIRHAYHPEAVVRVAEFYKDSNAIVGAKKRIAGLTLRASDVDWSTGSGPEVSGPILSLAMAMTGRTVALDDLSGEGLATLHSRMEPTLA